jgi:hypothetical protein
MNSKLLDKNGFRQEPSKYNITTKIYISLLLFALFAFFWYFKYSSYQLFVFQEETQLFRSDIFYFLDYLSRPGGLCAYAGSFLTQFYRYIPIGIILLISLICSVYFLYLIVGRRIGVSLRFYAISFVIPILFVAAPTVDMHFRISFILGIGFILLAFYAYTFLKGKLRFIGGFLLYFLLYFIIGGNVLLFIALVFIHESLRKERSWKFLIGLTICFLSVPYLAYLFIYTATFKQTFFAQTPFVTPFFNSPYFFGWIGIPLVYLIWIFLSLKVDVGERIKPWKIFLTSYLIIIILCCGVIIPLKDENTEMASRIEYEVERANWDKVLVLSKQHEEITGQDNGIITFFTNLALLEKGILPDSMFHYKQLDLYNYYPHPSLTFYLPATASGELYYRMGVIQEAEHCAYEAMLATANEYGSKPLRRIVHTTMLRGDKPGFERYIRLFEASPIYKNWAKQQRKYFDERMKDPSYRIPGTPEAAKLSDFYMSYNYPEDNFIKLLKADSANRKAFEYYMGGHLLRRDVSSAFSLFEAHYPFMNYKKIPRLYEEMILMLPYVTKIEPKSLSHYPISPITKKEFEEYIKMASSVKSQRDQDVLKTKFKHTIWYN